MNKHHPPSVVYPVRRSNIEARLWVGVWLVGAVAILAWNQISYPGVWLLIIEIGLLCITALRAVWFFKNDSVSELIWDGAGWHCRIGTWKQDFELQQVVVLADFQRAFVLQTATLHGRLWIWVERGMAPERWMDLRRALYAAGEEMGDKRLLDLGKRKEIRPAAVSGGSNLKIEAARMPKS